MTIRGLIEWAHNFGHPGPIHSMTAAGAWRVEIEAGPNVHDKRVAELWHYGTRMLVWNIDSPLDSEVLDWSLGHASVSDQNGMNTAFEVLGLPYYYSRRGFTNVVSLYDRESRKKLPKYIRDNPEIHLGAARAACFDRLLHYSSGIGSGATHDRVTA